MTTNNPPAIQLQRRGGRRISIPTSPVPDRSLLERTPQLTSATTIDSSAESPSLDIKMPSPNLMFAGLPTAGQEQPHGHLRNNSREYQLGWQHSASTTDYPSQMSSPISDSGYRQSPYGAQPDMTIRSSPLANQHRDSPDGFKWTDIRLKPRDGPNVTGRNTNSTPVMSYDRSLNEEHQSRMPAAKKSRLNLLNPMSLLARRRSSQNTKLEDSTAAPFHVPAIPDFDPSIRGNIVHDFSAPRLRTPRRDVVSHPSQPVLPESNTPRPPPPPSPALHSPMFKEHFQDDDATLQPGQTSYLHNTPLDPPAADSLPAFAQKLPSAIPIKQASVLVPATVNGQSSDDVPPSPPSKSTTPVSIDTSVPVNLPKHMKSTSSRFSFQISGQGSAQERLLEDRHRQRFPEGLQELGAEIDEEDEGMYDFDADDGMEESIPEVSMDYDIDEDNFETDDIPVRNINLQSSQFDNGVDDDDNDDDDDDQIPIKDINIPTSQMQPTLTINTEKRQSLGFHFTPQSATLSPTSPQYNSQYTPRDSQGFPIGIADTKYSPTYYNPGIALSGTRAEEQLHMSLNGLRISTGDVPDSFQRPSSAAEAFDDADLYFDDGDFGIEAVSSDGHFDESLLDDETHIRDIPAENARRYEAALRRNAPDKHVSVVESNAPQLTHSLENSHSAGVDGSRALQPQSPTASKIILSCKVPSLTEDNLAAYHDALATAATNAASEGRFTRQVSFSESSRAAEEVPWSSSQSGLVSDDSRYSLNVGMGTVPDDDPFLFDDDADYDYDLMIAEANAEALENDDEGFYGQEFGFYARAYGKDQPDSMHGGYFTARGSNGIKRSHSGKADFQEPSLTPITERSEWSARNSVVSLPFHSGVPNSSQSLPSPGLNQLMDSPAIEDEMTLSALMKLRRGAFGGSSTSINSLGDRSVPNSSPLAHVSGFKFPPLDTSSNRLSLTSPGIPGSFSIMESEEEDEDFERATMTQNTPRKARTDLNPHPPNPNTSNLKVETPVTAKKGHHSRNSSGAESVSYARDDDGRWILERRRTGDDGELELVAREYLAGARI